MVLYHDSKKDKEVQAVGAGILTGYLCGNSYSPQVALQMARPYSLALISLVDSVCTSVQYKMVTQLRSLLEAFPSGAKAEWQQNTREELVMLVSAQIHHWWVCQHAGHFVNNNCGPLLRCLPLAFQGWKEVEQDYIEPLRPLFGCLGFDFDETLLEKAYLVYASREFYRFDLSNVSDAHELAKRVAESTSSGIPDLERRYLGDRSYTSNGTALAAQLEYQGFGSITRIREYARSFQLLDHKTTTRGTYENQLLRIAS